MKNQFRFRPYNPDHLMLFAPDLKQWLPEDDLVYFIIDVINELEVQVQQLLKQAEACDQQEDALYGKGKRGDQLPKQLQFRK